MIAFNYDEAMEQSRELDRICEDLRDVLERSLRPQSRELGAAWKGTCARIYLQKDEELMSDIARTIRLASGISGAVRSAAKTIKAAEDAAKKIAQTIIV